MAGTDSSQIIYFEEPSIILMEVQLLLQLFIFLILKYYIKINLKKDHLLFTTTNI